MSFSVGSSTRFGWETFKKRPGFLIVVFLIIGIFSNGFNSLTDNHTVYTPSTIALLITASLIGFIVQILTHMGKNQMVLKAYDDVGSVTFGDLWAPHPFWKFVGAYFLVTAIVVGGLILLIIPGIIWGLKYMFVPLLIIDKKMRPFDALKESARITNGHKWDLLVFVITLFGINILGFLCLFVGLLVSIPVSSLAFVYAYRTLSQQTH